MVSRAKRGSSASRRAYAVIIWADGKVSEIQDSWPGAVELTASRTDNQQLVRALAYTDLMPTPTVGDRVLLNVAALDRGLGTGGYALVVAVLDPAGRVTAQPPQPAGHLVKARYLPLQAMVAGADEQGSEHHELLRDADSLDGLPVVVADLHSALAPATLAVAYDRPGTRVVYVMTDQGALPLAFSRSVAALRSAGLLAGTVTVGQAFGGDLEAVTVHSGSAGGPAGAGRGSGDRVPGPGQPGHRHPLGLLGGERRRGGQRDGRTAWPPGRVAAHLGDRPPRPASRRVPPQPDRVRAGCASPCDVAVPDFAGEPDLVELMEPVRQAWLSCPDIGWSPSTSPVYVTCWPTPPSGCPAWAGGWPTIPATSWPPPRRAGTRPPCSS